MNSLFVEQRWEIGDIRIEVLKNIQEAIEVYIESFKAHNEPIPLYIDEKAVT